MPKMHFFYGKNKTKPYKLNNSDKFIYNGEKLKAFTLRQEKKMRMPHLTFLFNLELERLIRRPEKETLAICMRKETDKFSVCRRYTSVYIKS